MKTILGTLFLFQFLLVAALAGRVQANSIAGIQFEPSSGTLKFGEMVKVSLAYEDISARKFIIHLDPLAQNRVLPHQFSTETKIRNLPDGQINRKFTLLAGTSTLVDGMRIRVEDVFSHRLLFSVVIPVHFTFEPRASLVSGRVVSTRPITSDRVIHDDRRFTLTKNSISTLPLRRPPKVSGSYLRLSPELINRVKIAVPIAPPSNNYRPYISVSWIRPPDRPDGVGGEWNAKMENFMRQLNYILKVELQFRTGDTAYWQDYFGEQDVTVYDKAAIYLGCLGMIQGHEGAGGDK